MAHTVQLSDGTTTISLEYAAGSQEDYKLRFLRQRADLGIVPMVHRPDVTMNGPEPVQLNLDNREWFLDMTVFGTSRNDQLNNLSALHRAMLDASRARTESPFAGWYLHFLLDSATNWTRYNVKWAKVVDDSGLFEPVSMKSGVTAPTAHPVVVYVVTEPLGYGNTETLKNVCRNASFQEDSNSDGLADFWESYNTIAVETLALDTTYYLAGGKSQKVTTTAVAGNQGIRSLYYPISGGDDCAARVCIYKASGATVYAQLTGNVGGMIDSGSTAAPTSTETDATGASWKIIDLGGTSAGGDSYVRVDVYRDTASATVFYVDRVYLRTDDSQTLPTAWASRYVITNHADNGYELTTNGNFETGGVGGADVFGTWGETAGDGTIADGGAGHGGAAHALLTSGATMNTELDQSITTVALEPYTLEFWTKGDGTNAGRYQIYNNTGAADIVATASTSVTADTWTKLRVPFIAPASCVSVLIRLWGPAVNGGHAHFDDVTVLAPSHVNYIEVAKVPGDQRAPVRIYNETAGVWGTEPMYLWIGNHDDSPGAFSGYLEQYSAAGTADRKYTATSVTNAWIQVGQLVLSAATKRGEYVMLACLNDQDAAPGQVRAKVIWGSSATGLSTYYYSEAVTLADNQLWTVEAVGPVNLMWPDVMESGLVTLNCPVDVECKHDANTADVWCDAIYLMPAHGGICVAAMDAVDADDAKIVLDGLSERDGSFCAVDSITMRMLKPPIQGDLPKLRPNVHQRLHFMARQFSTNYHDTAFSDANLGAFTIVYRPRTASLLGTT